jgi:hypothetical protein
LPGWKLLVLALCCGLFLGVLLLSAFGGDTWAVPSSNRSTVVPLGKQGGRSLPSPTFGPDGRPTWYGRIKPKKLVATPREAIQWAATDSLWEKVSISHPLLAYPFSNHQCEPPEKVSACGEEESEIDADEMRCWRTTSGFDHFRNDNKLYFPS